MIIPGVVLDHELAKGGFWHSNPTIEVISQAPRPAADEIRQPIGSKPSHGGELMKSGPRFTTEDWRKSGGTTMLYMQPPAALGSVAPRTFGYRVPTPISPLLGLGFGLNLALFASEYFGWSHPGVELDPWGNPIAY